MTGVLVAFQDDYHAYRQMIAAAIRVLRPHVEVETAALEELAERIECLDPELVICTQTNTVNRRGRLAWIELSLDPLQPTKVCIGGRYSELINPTVEVLLEVIDEADQLLQTNNDFRGC